MSDQKQIVWVVMGNDYPDAVFASEAAAERYIETKKKGQQKEVDYPCIYWRSYAFGVRT